MKFGFGKMVPLSSLAGVENQGKAGVPDSPLKAILREKIKGLLKVEPRLQGFGSMIDMGISALSQEDCEKLKRTILDLAEELKGCDGVSEA